MDDALEFGMIDDVIDPRDTRPLIIKALKMAKERREGFILKRHGIIPI